VYAAGEASALAKQRQLKLPYTVRTSSVGGVCVVQADGFQCCTTHSSQSMPLRPMAEAL
jgi:hypothetical protein